MAQSSKAPGSVQAQRAQRAHYLLAMGITPWIDQTSLAEAPVVEPVAADSPPSPTPSSAGLQLVVHLSEAVQQSLSWSEPTGRLLLNMFRALGIDPKKVLFGAASPARQSLPVWQFGGEGHPENGVVLPELEALLADPELKKTAWQKLSGHYR